MGNFLGSVSCLDFDDYIRACSVDYGHCAGIRGYKGT